MDAATCKDWTLPGELWLPVPDLEGRYEASDLGRTRSLNRLIRYSNGVERWHRGVVLTPTVGTRGYLNVSIPRAEESTEAACRHVHEVVTLTFLGPRPLELEVRHLNGIPSDCRLANLVYGTKSENTLDQTRHGTHALARREQCPFGHVLALPNLVKSQLPYRTCLACMRAHSKCRYHRVKKGVILDRQAEANRYYIDIMRRT